jgi:hypothetical protein
MYSYLWKKHGINNETNDSKTAKGIVKSVIKNELCFELFKNCLFEREYILGRKAIKSVMC